MIDKIPTHSTDFAVKIIMKGKNEKPFVYFAHCSLVRARQNAKILKGNPRIKKVWIVTRDVQIKEFHSEEII